MLTLQEQLGLVGPLGNQSINDFCYDKFHFVLYTSTCANIEGQWALKGKKLISLSTEQLVDCDGSQDIAKLVLI